MPNDDQPSRDIWMNSDALESHFQALRDRYRGGNREVESIPLDQNELTRGLRSG